MKRPSIRLAGLWAASALTFGTVVLAPSAASAQVVAARPSSMQDNHRIVSAAFSRWAAGQGDFFNAILAPDAVWTIEGSGPSAGTFKGRDVFLKQAVQPFAARMSTMVRPVSHRVWADGDHVIVNWVGEGVAGDGAAYRNTYVWILRMREAKAVEVNAFLDLPAYDDVLRRVPLEPSVKGQP